MIKRVILKDKLLPLVMFLVWYSRESWECYITQILKVWLVYI
jgi:hypothetical protein